MLSLVEESCEVTAATVYFAPVNIDDYPDYYELEEHTHLLSKMKIMCKRMFQLRTYKTSCSFHHSLWYNVLSIIASK